MNRQIESIRQARTSLLEQVEDLTVDQFNQIPIGFQNNINWNMGHMVVVQQRICYKKSGLAPSISDDFVEKFRPGSRPEGMIGVLEIVNIKHLLVSTLDQLETDYKNRVFANYNAWTSRLGTKIANIDDGLEFLAFHEQLHAKTIKTKKKMVKK